MDGDGTAQASTATSDKNRAVFQEIRLKHGPPLSERRASGNTRE
jgi:hypothetical protein